jgi:hypothetical protein
LDKLYKLCPAVRLHRVLERRHLTGITFDIASYGGDTLWLLFLNYPIGRPDTGFASHGPPPLNELTHLVSYIFALCSVRLSLNILPSAGFYDTPKDVVEQVTYKLPAFDPSPFAALPPLPAETEYLDLIYNPSPEQNYDPSAPFEQYLKMDLTNPHSRAKKLQRWKIRQSIIHSQLKEITDYELAHLEGRTERQAKADAAFRWREQVKKEAAERKKVRWMHADKLESWKRKNVSKAKKEERQRRRLTELMLGDEENQVIPAALKAQKPTA